MRTNFQTKQTTLNILAQVYPKLEFGIEIRKFKSGFGISILEILCAPIFRQNGQLWIFWPKFAQKWFLGSEFQKSKSEFGISTSKIPCVPIFSQNGQLLIFWPKFGEIAQLRAIFWFKYCWGCCRELSGGGWSLMTYLKICLRLQVTHQSCYIVNGIIDHHCTRDIPGTRFHLIPFLEVEILVGRGWVGEDV